MNHDERVAYAQQMLAHELSFVKVIFISEPAWRERFLANDTVDPVKKHKPFGMSAPHLVEEKWVLGVCIPILIRYLANHSDDDLQTWLEYWVLHTSAHLIVNKEALDRGESVVPAVEFEQRVTTFLEAQESDALRQAEQFLASLPETT